MTQLLTAVYLGLGANTALEDAPRYGVGSLAEFNGGQLEFMDAVTSAATLVDKVGDYIAEIGGHPGVWLYDVVEPFGYELAKQILMGGHLSHSHLLADVCTVAGYDNAVLSAAFSRCWVVPETIITPEPEPEPSWMPFLVVVVLIAALAGILDWVTWYVAA